MEDFYIHFGQRLRAARTSAGLTQAALAHRVSLKRTSITNMENGEQRLHVHLLDDLADALGVCPLVLLGRGGPSSDAETPDAVRGLNPEIQRWATRVVSQSRERRKDLDHEEG